MLALRRHARRAVLALDEPSTGGSLYRRAVAGGAQATQGATGIAVGQAADIVSLNVDDIAFEADGVADGNGQILFRPADVSWREDGQGIAAKIVRAVRGLGAARFDMKYSAGTLSHARQ